MYTLLGSEKGQLAPRRAETLLRLNTFAGQRPLSNEHVQLLAKANTDGTFRRGDIATAKCSFNGGKEVLINGQHQLHACILSGKPMYAVIDRYDCPNKDDLWHLFGTFDVHRARSEGHILKAARGLFRSKSLQTVPLRVLQVCGGALVYLGSGTKPNFSAKPSNKCRKTELVQDHEKDVHVVASYFDNDTRAMMTTPVVAAIIATHRANDDKARVFWANVLHGNDLKKNSPQHQLHKKLSLGNWTVAGNRSNLNYRNMAIYSLCVTWWNAWRTGESRVSVKINAMKSLPEVEK